MSKSESGLEGVLLREHESIKSCARSTDTPPSRMTKAVRSEKPYKERIFRRM